MHIHENGIQLFFNSSLEIHLAKKSEVEIQEKLDNLYKYINCLSGFTEFRECGT